MLQSLALVAALAASVSTVSADRTVKSSAVAATKLNTDDWTYKGCYNIYAYGDRNALYPGGNFNQEWTATACLAAAKQAGYAVAVVDYGGECFGTNSVPDAATAQDVTTCNWTCNDNNDETCGGESTEDIYVATSYTKVIDDAHWAYRGCYRDSNDKRTIANLVTASKWNVKSCLAAVKSARYSVGGLEAGGECWGATELSQTASSIGAGNCTQTCNDQAGQTCGGSNALDVYFLKTASTKVLDDSAWSYEGCYTDSIAKRTLGNLVQRPSTNSKWTASSCLDAAASAGYAYAGVIYGGECWGDNTIRSTASQLTSTRCAWTCNDSTFETCGGEAGMDIYKTTATSSTSASRRSKRHARRA